VQTCALPISSAGTRNSPPKPPGTDSTLGVFVRRTRSMMLRLARAAVWRSTPASPYVSPRSALPRSDMRIHDDGRLEGRQVAEMADARLDLIVRQPDEAVHAEALDRKAAERAAVDHRATQLGG